MKRHFALWVVLAILLPSNAYADLKLKMYTEHFPPYSYVENNAVTGLNSDLVKLSCEKAQIHCDFLLYPWLRAYETVQREPATALYSTSRNKLREPLFKWVGPLAFSQSNLYRLKSRPDMNLKTLEDAKRYVIAVVRGDVHEMYLRSEGFEHGVNLLALSTKLDAVALFLQGKVDFLIASELVLPIWLAEHRYKIDDVEKVLDLSEVGVNYLALNLSVPDDVVNKLQLALNELRESGEYQRLLESYLYKREN